MLRRQIATSVLITMGRKITHFEGDIDPLTGTVDVNFTFQPIVLPDEHLGLQHCDPDDVERKIKDCAVLRVYSKQVDPLTGDAFSHLLGCQAINLCRSAAFLSSSFVSSLVAETDTCPLMFLPSQPHAAQHRREHAWKDQAVQHEGLRFCSAHQLLQHLCDSIRVPDCWGGVHPWISHVRHCVQLQQRHRRVPLFYMSQAALFQCYTCQECNRMPSCVMNIVTCLVSVLHVS
jgi:hypothetical protein